MYKVEIPMVKRKLIQLVIVFLKEMKKVNF